MNLNSFISQRNRLAIKKLFCIALSPIPTVIGNYQWLTFTIMNLAFYPITTMENNRSLCFLKNKPEIFEVFAFTKEQGQEPLQTSITYGDLIRREVEIVLSIFEGNDL